MDNTQHSNPQDSVFAVLMAIVHDGYLSESNMHRARRALDEVEQTHSLERADVLTTAAKIAEVERQRALAQSSQNNRRQSDIAFGKVTCAEKIAELIRALQTADNCMEEAARICMRESIHWDEAPANALMECAAAIRNLPETDDRDEGLEKAALLCDRSGHYWSGAPALVMFKCAEAIRDLKTIRQNSVTA